MSTSQSVVIEEQVATGLIASFLTVPYLLRNYLYSLFIRLITDFATAVQYPNHNATDKSSSIECKQRCRPCGFFRLTAIYFFSISSKTFYLIHNRLMTSSVSQNAEVCQHWLSSHQLEKLMICFATRMAWNDCWRAHFPTQSRRMTCEISLSGIGSCLDATAYN